MSVNELMSSPGWPLSGVSVVKGPAGYADATAIEKMIEEAFDRLGLPAGWVPSGGKVILKPNWVKEHDERYPGPDRWEHVITHPAIIEAVAKWVGARMGGHGSVIVCDAPQTDSSFAKIRAYCRLDEVLERCRATVPGVTFNLLDLRPEEWTTEAGVTVAKETLPGDPLGATHVGLNDASEFVGFAGQGRLYGASYDMAETNARHAGQKHEYLLCRTPMEADLLINLPKLKTHKKVGLTCALKNLVGINANKNWLPHHTEGTPDEGGDQFPAATVKAKLEHRWMGSAKRWLKHRPGISRLFVPVKRMGRWVFGDTQKVVRSGNWHGNDTCWRMVVDLNKCLFFFGGDGARRKVPLKYLALVDGIIGGEGNGPMAPDPKASGLVIAGTHPAAVDVVAATLMGFDWRRIRMLAGCFSAERLNFTPFRGEEIRVSSNHQAWAGPVMGIHATPVFRPHFGWIGGVERVEEASSR